jgi:DNA-binding CsgD family transcriptional regulator
LLSLRLLRHSHPGRRLELDPFVIAAAFDLTPGEPRVAARAANGMTQQEIALEHTISISTIRSQLRSIFTKTETKTQGDLVSLLATLPAFGCSSERLTPREDLEAGSRRQ